jgi:cystathionine beta-lyase
MAETVQQPIQENKAAIRRAFLRSCTPRTVDIQNPLIDPIVSRGHPNPAGLGEADRFSREGSWGQSSVLFPDLASYQAADETGVSPYGGAEYGVVLTPEADAVCRKIAALHGGFGAIICPSGLSAITTTIAAFAPRALLIPDNAYPPLLRYLRYKNICVFRYPSDASAGTVSVILREARREFRAARDIMIYLEAPGSGTFEIPDISGIAALAKSNGIISVMDNTWASHVRFKPITAGIDIVIQATTKYEGGYGDTPSGVVIAAQQAGFECLVDELRISGHGAVAPTTCARLLKRIDSTEARLDAHHETALQLVAWFQSQAFVADVLSPALPGSPCHTRFNEYFGKGNGLFSVVFRPTIPASQVAAFVEALNLFWVGESWGGHVSLVLPVCVQRELTSAPKGQVLRFHAGLEDASDLQRDLEQAARASFIPVINYAI